MYNIHFEFGIPKKLVWLDYLNEPYSKFQADKLLSHIFPIENGLKPGDALLPLQFNSAFEYAFKKVQANQEGLKFKWYASASVLHRLWYCIGWKYSQCKRNTEPFVVISMELGLEGNAETTKNMAVSRLACKTKLQHKNRQYIF